LGVKQNIRPFGSSQKTILFSFVEDERLVLDTKFFRQYNVSFFIPMRRSELLRVKTMQGFLEAAENSVKSDFFNEDLLVKTPRSFLTAA
jgi:hypothetical protein